MLDTYDVRYVGDELGLRAGGYIIARPMGMVAR